MHSSLPQKAALYKIVKENSVFKSLDILRLFGENRYVYRKWWIIKMHIHCISEDDSYSYSGMFLLSILFNNLTGYYTFIRKQLMNKISVIHLYQIDKRLY